VFQNELAKSLEVIRLESVWWDYIWEDRNQETNEKDPGIIYWTPLPRLKTLYIKDCEPFSAKALRFQRFEKLETLQFHWACPEFLEERIREYEELFGLFNTSICRHDAGLTIRCNQ